MRLAYGSQYLGQLRSQPPPRPPPPPEEDTPPIQGPPAPESWGQYLSRLRPSTSDLSDMLDAAAMSGVTLGPLLGVVKNPKVVQTAEDTFHILDEAGKPIGMAEAWMSRKSGVPQLIVKLLGFGEQAGEIAAPKSQLGTLKGKIGYTGMRNVIRQLFGYFPEAERVDYYRGTGASAGTDAAFKNYPIPGRTPIPAAPEPVPSNVPEYGIPESGVAEGPKKYGR